MKIIKKSIVSQSLVDESIKIKFKTKKYIKTRNKIFCLFHKYYYKMMIIFKQKFLKYKKTKKIVKLKQKFQNK